MEKIYLITKKIITLCMLLLTTSVISQTTLLNEDFSSMGTGYVTETSSVSTSYQIVNDCIYETWEIVTSHEEECSSCIGNYVGIYYQGSSCTQNNIFVTKQFSPTETQLNISFDYAFDYYPSGTNYFEVYLYNETDGSQVGSDLVYVTEDIDESFSGVVNLTGSNTTDDNYTLRFKYYGNDDWGASFDNIVVTETTSEGNDIDVTIGTGTSESGLVPAYGLFDYSWSGMIYLQSEIDVEGDIETISFYVDASSPSSYVMNNQKIYMAHTTYSQFPSSSVQENFSSNYTSSDWTLVYDGTIDWSPGWEEITLSTPFSYNNTDNVLIKFENRDGSYSFSYPEFDYTSSTRRAAYEYQDGSYPTTNGARTNNRPNIKFSVSSSVVALPVTLISFNAKIIDNVTQPKTDIEWVVGSQINNHYFSVEHSIDGYNWEEINEIIGEFKTSDIITYSTTHTKPKKGINYYRLTQFDYDGESEELAIISVFLDKNSDREFIVKKINFVGQEVDDNYVGPIILLWDNGEITKTFNR